jgi:hypothetical protein
MPTYLPSQHVTNPSTRVTGTGFLGVVKRKPLPVPVGTRTCNPHGFTNPSYSLDIIEVDIQSMKGKGKITKVIPFLPFFIGHCSTKFCQNVQKPNKFEFRRGVNNSRTNAAIAGNTAINSVAKMKPPTAQKRKEPLGENRPL